MSSHKIYDIHVASLLRILSLRDAETEEHTERVTSMTLSFARLSNLSKDQLLYIRYGALLHDIGKIGIPDAILHKHGLLTEEERIVMKKHPIYAYQLLHPISYFRPALDIPYCHHEKWDGSGYPRGLKGEQIPYAARLFAIVDVWDALCSDRPYRAAWTKERASAYIHDQAGKHFDPNIAVMFNKLTANIGRPQSIDPLFLADSQFRVIKSPILNALEGLDD